MTAAMPDPIVGVIDYLKESTTLSVLLSERIYGGELPPSEVDSMPRKALVVAFSGGFQAFGRGYQQYGDIRIDTFLYGETPYEVDRVYFALYPHLKQMRTNRQRDCLLHWAKPSGSPLTLRDPDTDWPMSFLSWQVMVAEVTAA